MQRIFLLRREYFKVEATRAFTQRSMGMSNTNSLWLLFELPLSDLSAYLDWILATSSKDWDSSPFPDDDTVTMPKEALLPGTEKERAWRRHLRGRETSSCLHSTTIPPLSMGRHSTLRRHRLACLGKTPKVRRPSRSPNMTKAA